MRDDFRRAALVVSLIAGLSGRVSTADPGTSENASSGATLVNYGSLLRPRCENADMQVINGQNEAVCRAYLESIDGKPASHFSNETHVVPGTHRVALGCSFAIIGPNDHGAVPQIKSSATYEGTFSPGVKYYIRAEMRDDHCRIWVSETPAGPPAPLWKAFMP